MPLEFYDGNDARMGGTFVTVDKYGRLCLSAKTRELLGVRNIPAKLYVGYDSANKRIGLAKPDIVRMTDKNPLHFSADKGYAAARGFLAQYKIPHDKSYRYNYVGQENGAHVFELSTYNAPDSVHQPEIQERKGKR
jgi:hypothetical protein